MHYIIFFDGACEPCNPNGNLGMGVAVFDTDGALLHNDSKCILHGSPGFEKTSNNVAEYLAVIMALDWVKLNASSGDTVTLYGDSKLVVNQMNLDWGVNGGIYEEFANEAFRKQVDLTDMQVHAQCEWVPRDKNSFADSLSKEALTREGITITERKK